MPDVCAAYADKISMRHALAARAPHLDHDIIEFVGHLPASMRVRRGRRKWLHGRVCLYFPPRGIIHDAPIWPRPGGPAGRGRRAG